MIAFPKTMSNLTEREQHGLLIEFLSRAQPRVLPENALCLRGLLEDPHAIKWCEQCHIKMIGLRPYLESLDAGCSHDTSLTSSLASSRTPYRTSSLTHENALSHVCASKIAEFNSWSPNRQYELVKDIVSGYRFVVDPRGPPVCFPAHIAFCYMCREYHIPTYEGGLRDHPYCCVRAGFGCPTEYCDGCVKASDYIMLESATYDHHSVRIITCHRHQSLFRALYLYIFIERWFDEK